MYHYFICDLSGKFGNSSSLQQERLQLEQLNNSKHLKQITPNIKATEIIYYQLSWSVVSVNGRGGDPLL